MVNKPKIKGTGAETLLVGYLRANGWPYAERRALSGSLDKGDIAGTGPLVWESKATGGSPQIPAWLAETETERRNAGAEYGILVVKTRGLGVVYMGRWLAVMTLPQHEKLVANSTVKVLASTLPRFYSSMRLSHEFTALAIDQAIMREEAEPGSCPSCPVVAAHMMPPGTKDDPSKHYRAMRLEQMVHLLHGAGFGEIPHGAQSGL